MEKLKNIITLLICLQIIIPFVVEGCLPVLVSHFLHNDRIHNESKNHPFHKYFIDSFNQTLALNLEIVPIKFCPNFNFNGSKTNLFKKICFQSNFSVSI